MYFPVRQVLRNPMAYVVAASGDRGALTASVRQAVATMDPAIPIYDARGFDTYVDQARAGNRFLALLAAGFALIAVLLTTVGVYGVVAYTATERRREFGVRLALGAAPGQIAALVFRGGAWLAGAGLVGGAVVAGVAAYALRGQLVDVLPLDPASYAAAALVLILAATAATWIPARRATMSNPLDVLRRD